MDPEGLCGNLFGLIWALFTETHGGFKSTWCVAPKDSVNAAEDEEVLRQGGVVAGNSSFKAARAEGETNVLWGRSWVEPQSKVMPEALIPSLAVGQSSIREFA